MDDHAINSTAQPRFLMCRPQYFAVSYSINPWMDPQGWASAGSVLYETANWQWAVFHDALLDKGASIEFDDPKPGLPDLVFTANAAIVLDGKALLSRFRHPERQREEPVFAAAFQTLHAQAQLDSVKELPEEIILEGAGDCIWDPHRRQFWMGYGTRSNAEAALIVTEHFEVECVGLELADPSFYHLDTAFCALPSGDVIYYPGAFTPSGRHAIEERVAYEQRIVLDRAEAAQFSANAVSFDHCLVLSSCTDALRRNVEERGFTVLTTPLHTFLRSGGSACCLTLRLDHRSEETNSRFKGGETTSELLYGGGL
jgi:N-dimethylarginine dimethylaminohydrolase